MKFEALHVTDIDAVVWQKHRGTTDWGNIHSSSSSSLELDDN